MSNLIIKLFIKDGDVKDLKTREKYGTLSGGVGIFCNLILCIFKFIVGALSNSVSITADAVNNLRMPAQMLLQYSGQKWQESPLTRIIRSDTEEWNI